MKCVFSFNKQKSCPAEWTSLVNSCYLPYTIRKVWSTARQFCFSKGGDLAVITSQLEMDVVIGHFNASLTSGTWLGGVYNGTMMSWQWINGEPWMFDNLAQGETYKDDQRLTLKRVGASPKRHWDGMAPDSVQYLLCERQP